MASELPLEEEKICMTPLQLNEVIEDKLTLLEPALQSLLLHLQELRTDLMNGWIPWSGSTTDGRVCDD